MSKALLVSTAIAASVALHAGAPVQQPTAADLAQRLQAKQQAVKSFTARYTQEHTAPYLPQKGLASGNIKVLKPNRLWMTQEKPDVKHVVADGRYGWDYDVANKFAWREELPKDGSGSTGMLFLTGSADLTRDFSSALAPSSPAGEWHLVLTPKSATSEFATLTMIVARDTLKLIGFITVDKDGGRNSWRFTNLVENAPLQASQFVLVLPKDVHTEVR